MKVWGLGGSWAARSPKCKLGGGGRGGGGGKGIMGVLGKMSESDWVSGAIRET